MRLVCEGAVEKCGDCQHAKPHESIATCIGVVCNSFAEKFMAENPDCLNCKLAKTCTQWAKRQNVPNGQSPTPVVVTSNCASCPGFLAEVIAAKCVAA
jgi:hypothetical protein